MGRLLPILLLLLSACGDDDGGATAPVGTWRLVSDSSGGAGVDGWLEVTSGEYALALARPAVKGTATAFHVSGSSLELGSGESVAFSTPAAGKLALVVAPQRTLTFDAAQAVRADTIPVKGTVTYAAGAAEMVHPRVALIFLKRELTGAVGFTDDPRDDHPLNFTSGSTPIDLPRDREALGTERITFGDIRVGIAIGMVVVYDDRDSSGSLDDLFTPCSTATKDCIRGVSSVFLGYRDGTSAELTASPYAFLRPGWSHSVVSSDTRAGAGRVGLLSTDPQQDAAHDLTIPVDAATVQVPAFKL